MKEKLEYLLFSISPCTRRMFSPGKAGCDSQGWHRLRFINILSKKKFHSKGGISFTFKVRTPSLLRTKTLPTEHFVWRQELSSLVRPWGNVRSVWKLVMGTAKVFCCTSRKVRWNYANSSSITRGKSWTQIVLCNCTSTLNTNAWMEWEWLSLGESNFSENNNCGYEKSHNVPVAPEQHYSCDVFKPNLPCFTGFSIWWQLPICFVYRVLATPGSRNSQFCARYFARILQIFRQFSAQEATGFHRQLVS